MFSLLKEVPHLSIDLSRLPKHVPAVRSFTLRLPKTPHGKCLTGQIEPTLLPPSSTCPSLRVARPLRPRLHLRNFNTPRQVQRRSRRVMRIQESFTVYSLHYHRHAVTSLITPCLRTTLDTPQFPSIHSLAIYHQDSSKSILR